MARKSLMLQTAWDVVKNTYSRAARNRVIGQERRRDLSVTQRVHQRARVSRRRRGCHDEASGQLWGVGGGPGGFSTCHARRDGRDAGPRRPSAGID